MDRFWSVGRVALAVCLSWPVLVSAATVQVGFSPEGSAQALVLQVIGRASRSVRVLGYSFTAADVTSALVEAQKRGVDVAVVLDKDGNRSKTAIAAIGRLVAAGIPVRIDGRYRIAHDKVIVTDSCNVETGSFNYTQGAERYNSENVIVLWDACSVAEQYLQHWQDRWAKSVQVY